MGAAILQGTRAVAFIIDWMIIYAAAVALGLFLPVVFAAAPVAHEDLQRLVPLSLLIIVFGYTAGLTSSSTQATLGKMAMGIKVTDTHGRPTSLSRALAREVSKLFSLPVFAAGFIMAAFTKRKQALHDKIAGTLVVEQ
jgi:uncharacterized RDD family membrane protein YckC